MLKHMGLVAVVVALVTLTSDTVHARGGARGTHFRSYNFGNSGYYYYPSTRSNVSSHHRSTSATSKSSAHSNTSSSGQTVQTTTPSTAVTTKSPTLAGTGTSNTSAQPTTATKAGVGTLHSPAQTPTTNTVATSPLTISPFAGVPLSTEPNTTAQRNYRGLLHNAKELIKAGMYAPAAADLQRIINGAPGTRIAAEAQRLLAKLPV